MIIQTLKKMLTVALSSRVRGNAGLENNGRRAGFVLTVVCLVAVLAGCATEPSQKPVGKISLNQDPLVVTRGQTIELQARSSVFDDSGDWKYQWQTLVGDVATDIPDATRKKFVLNHVELKDGQLYRCKIYRTGDFGETNFTSVIGMEVTEFALMQNIGTPIIVSGPFQPSTSNPSPKGSCCYGCPNCMQTVSPSNSIWWAPDAGATTGQFTYLPAPGQSNGQVMAMNSGAVQAGAPWCGTNNTASFPVVAGKKYMLLICFPTNAPAKGTVLNFSVTWN